MKIIKIIGSLFVVGILFACSLEPKYIKPETPVTLGSDNIDKEKIANISWNKFFESPDLQRVIQLALDNNHDLRIANLNIASAQETHGIIRANLLPSINASASETRQGVAKAFSSFTPKKLFRANISLAAYEIDFFGKLRSLKKSALEDFLSSKQAYNITKISLITQTANSYAQLLLDREILQIAKENLDSQNNRYELTKIRYENGIDSQDKMLLSQNAIENAKINYEIYQKLVNQDEAALMLLVGVFDKKLLPLEKSITEIKINENLLDFFPSKSLLLRPDIKQAEHDLKSANANIGAARAAFFPSISLTGSYGYGSRSLNDLLDSKSWSFVPQINLPIFNGGRNVGNLELANLRKKVEIINYERTIQVAFREALDELSQKESINNQLNSFEKILKTNQKNYDLSEARYKAGINSVLNNIDNKIALLTAKQNQLISKKEYIANLITLYKVLGGGNELE